MEILDLNHIAIPVKDLEKSLKFYGEQLGLPQIRRPDFRFPGAWFRIGDGQELHLIEQVDGEWNTSLKSKHFALRVADIRRPQEKLERMALHYSGPKQRLDGAWQIFVQDPDGHFIEFCQL